MANVNKNDRAVLNNLIKSGMVKPTLPRAIDPKASMQAAIAARRKELCK
jgi:hypothetical protein